MAVHHMNIISAHIIQSLSFQTNRPTRIKDCEGGYCVAWRKGPVKPNKIKYIISLFPDILLYFSLIVIIIFENKH